MNPFEKDWTKPEPEKGTLYGPMFYDKVDNLIVDDQAKSEVVVNQPVEEAKPTEAIDFNGTSLYMTADAGLIFKIPKYRCKKGHEWGFVNHLVVFSGNTRTTWQFCPCCYGEWMQENFGQGIEEIK